MIRSLRVTANILSRTRTTGGWKLQQQQHRGLAATASAVRHSGSSRSPGADPLEILRQECASRQLCDEHGNRKPGAHWVCAIATVTDAVATSPIINLRTVDIQRVTPAGIDFILKAGSTTSQQLETGASLSLMHRQGHFLPGESAEQWRGEGSCVTLPLDEDLLAILPVYTLTSMIGSQRYEKEQQEEQSSDDSSSSSSAASSGRSHVSTKSHLTELWQRVRQELDEGKVSDEELVACVQPFRFKPDRLECMYGGPDSVMWNRWEWTRHVTAASTNPDDPLEWNETEILVPH